MFLICFSGCSINIPLVSPQYPLQERVVAGSGEDKILLLDISGIISMEGKSRLGGIAKEPGLVARIKDELKLARQDEAIKAIVLKINSPGGTVTASDIIHHELTEFKRKTGVKVVACLMELGTSGAYYIAAAADKIVAHPTTVTGSVGVMVMKLSLADLMQKIGIRNETVTSGNKKDILLPYRSFEVEERKIVQQVVDKLQQRFLQVVRQGRPNISAQQVQWFDDGRILTAQEAKEIGLIDRIGYLDQAFESARQLAGLTEARIIRYRPPLSNKGNIYTQAREISPQTTLGSHYLNSLLPGVNPYFMYLWLP